MKKLTPSEFKKHTVKMLIEVTDYLEAHNLRYIIDYGTLIGCIRHKGFIPWDDDIDISMPREDLDKLYELLKKDDFSFSENLKLADTRNKYTTHNTFNKIIDINTITESKVRKKKYWYPIWIDIFPYDKIPNDEALIKKTKTYYDKTIKIAQMPLFNDFKKHKAIKAILGFFLTPFVDPWLTKINKKTASFKGNRYYDFTASLQYRKDYGAKGDNFYCDSKLFNDYIYKTFEGHKFRVPKDYDTHLKKLYGDYMVLPPEEKRITHFENSYILEKGEKKYGEK